jgi:hypothetical protein
MLVASTTKTLVMNTEIRYAANQQTPTRNVLATRIYTGHAPFCSKLFPEGLPSGVLDPQKEAELNSHGYFPLCVQSRIFSPEARV